ncbi:hypothetical protein H4R34_000829 [Dimargaris verticillata]|uniref:Uncharacterized protein n=1 Tax=Dimargaris verticillata TaxID=2761393 RepID=A0A9W8BBX4_9FUNG|nr:hypothetical protein H4R34_000829 [Dimargaris verticillata]
MSLFDADTALSDDYTSLGTDALSVADWSFTTPTTATSAATDISYSDSVNTASISGFTTDAESDSVASYALRSRYQRLLQGTVLPSSSPVTTRSPHQPVERLLTDSSPPSSLFSPEDMPSISTAELGDEELARANYVSIPGHLPTTLPPLSTRHQSLAPVESSFGAPSFSFSQSSTRRSRPTLPGRQVNGLNLSYQRSSTVSERSGSLGPTQTDLVSFLRPPTYASATFYEDNVVDHDVELFALRQKLQALRDEELVQSDEANTLLPDSFVNDYHSPDPTNTGPVVSAPSQQQHSWRSSSQSRTPKSNRYTEALKRRRNMP